MISIDDGYERDINFRGTLFSSFSIHPKTRIIEKVFSGSTTIDVDSTIGFPNSGNLVVNVKNPATNITSTFNIEYKSKTLNQFLECSTIDNIVENILNDLEPESEVFSDAYAYGFSGGVGSDLIRIRVSGVLSDFEQNEKTYLYESGNKIKVRSLGQESKKIRDNKWIFNIPITYQVETVIEKDSALFEYEITFAGEHNFFACDEFYFDQSPELKLFVKSVTTKKSIIVRIESDIPSQIQQLIGDVNPITFRVPKLESYKITKYLSKGLFENYPELNIYNSNVQNVYIGKDQSTYVSSPSLPSYSVPPGAIELNIQDGSVSGSFLFGKKINPLGTSGDDLVESIFFADGTIDYSYFVIFDVDINGVLVSPKEHGFYTGDEIVFRSLDETSPIPDGIYYVKEFKSVGDPYGIKLSSSRSNIVNEKYVSPLVIPPNTVPEITNASCSLQFYDFSNTDLNSTDKLKPQLISPQNLIRKFSDPIQDTVKFNTIPGPVGMFVNGVEILNYKSRSNLFYGEIERIDVTSPGSNYDVINPPIITISDSGGASITFNASNSIPLIYNDIPIKFGVSDGGSVVTYDGDGGEEIIIDGKNLLLGENKLYINQTGGSTVRINGLLLSVGGSGGTSLGIGGNGGTKIRIFNNLLTLGTIGTGCEVFPNVIGSLERIDLRYPGFNYIGIPKIFVTGGNGSGALVEPIMESFKYEIPFQPLENIMDIDNDIIGFSTFHNFQRFEEIIYISGTTNPIPGLQDKSRYIISVVDASNIKLHKSREDASVGINTVDITGYGSGIHFIRSAFNKSKIGSIRIISPGEGYQNKKVSTIRENVNQITNVITIKNHGFSSGELIQHYAEELRDFDENGNPTSKDQPIPVTIGGVQENTSYYVTKIDDNNIKLSEIYTDQVEFEAPKDFLFQTKQYVNITGIGSGRLFFNYEPINVKIEGLVGVSTFGSTDLNAKFIPIFRGKIESLFLANGGSGYGSLDVLNYSKQPNVNVKKGSNASAIPIISNGGIAEVLMTNFGVNYTSTPDIVVRGDGIGAELIPILEDEKIKQIEVLYSGSGYKPETTTIDIIERGEGLKISTSIKSWNVNLLKRYQLTDRITDDEGFVYSGLNNKYGLQYSHIYLPKKLRELVYNDYLQGNTFLDSLSDELGGEKRHSPIVGWAYDGNPIYGPYGYANGQSGTIKALTSGYKLIESPDRIGGPSRAIYPDGFFVEDYKYDSSLGSDLDENNGRFCKTPEFPNGTYAYFCSIDTTQPRNLNTGLFNSAFPYVIGNKYKSKPIDFNFDVFSNQDDIDLNKTEWYRNTTPYNINNKDFSDYKYLLVPNKVKTPISEIKYATYGELETVDIIVSGDNYKVGDRINFENSDVIGQNATAEIEEIKGKSVRDLSISRSSFNNVEFAKYGAGTEVVGFVDEPHEYTSGDIVSISTPIERVVFKDINFSINVLLLTDFVDVSSVTGLTTYFSVSGNLSKTSIRENDIYKIFDPGSSSNEFEEVKVLNIYPQTQTIRVLREYNSYTSIAGFSTGTRLSENPRKFSTNLGIQTYYNYETNFTKHFNTSESLGVGDSFGPGITTSNYFVYPKSVGVTSITIPTRSIYIPNHGFETNEILSYTGSSIIVSPDGTTENQFFIESTDKVRSVKLSEDLIGISTGPVGIDSLGNIVSLENGNDALVYFLNKPTNTSSSFRTQRPNILTAKVSQSIVTVSTSSTHGLKENDIIKISVNPTTTKTTVIEYNDEARLLVVDPKNFVSSDVDVQNNTITIENHKYNTGNKILYKSNSPISGLIDNELYYIVAIDRNTFALTTSLFESQKEFPQFINFGSSEDGTIYSVNPEIDIIEGQTIFFDLSSESLSFTQGSSPQRISAFKFDIFEDISFNHVYISSGETDSFDVLFEGSVGDIGASVKLNVTNKTPKNLYYKLTPIDVNGIPIEKLGIFIDSEEINNNRITVRKSNYDGEYRIFDPIERDPLVPPFLYSEFKYQIPVNPESESYTFENSTIQYSTKSKNTFGPIFKAVIKNRGRYFYKLPKKTTIISANGSGAILSANSRSIGEIKTVNIRDIGFDYPSDFTIRPIAKLPTIYKVEPLYSIDFIRILNTGTNYLSAPNIAVIDNKTNERINDIVLSYQLGDNFVSIIRNTKNLSNVIPKLIPIDNSNGIPVLLNQGDPIILDANDTSDPDEVILATSVSGLDLDDPDVNSQYNSLVSASPVNSQALIFSNIPTARIFLATEYSSIADFPFRLGDTIFIEDVITIEETNGGTSNGYNSINNGFAFYKVVRVDPNIGGAGGSIWIDFSGYIDDDVLDPEDSNFYKVDEILSEAARVIPTKFFPTYETFLQKNNFILDEELVTELGTSIGTVEQWDDANDYLKIAETITFEEGDTIIGQSSKTKAILLTKIEFDAGYVVSDSSVVNKGWDFDTGKLNNDLQRMHDSDYYQYFSYALNSKISITEWNDDVGALNHTSGYKRFGNLQVDSSGLDFTGIRTDQNAGVSFGLSDIISEVSTNCYYDFDLVREITFGNPIKSNELVFGSAILQDYIESISNRVLSIDDISKNFEALPRETNFSVIARADSTEIRTIKRFFYVQDRRFLDDKQTTIFVTTHNDVNVVSNEYGRVETNYDMAFYESDIVGTQQNLLFYPTNAEINNYLIDFVSFEMTDDPADVETLGFGDVAYIYNQVGLLPEGSIAGVGTTAVGIGSTFRASKLLVQIGAASTSYREVNEITVMHDDVGNVRLVEYGEITTRTEETEASPGICTYGARMSEDGSSLDIIMTPREDLTDDYNIKTVTISVGNSSFTNTDSLGFETGEVSSFTISGISTEIPEVVDVTQYNTQYKCSYIFNTLSGIQTTSYVPYALGDRNHGVSDWYAFDDSSDVTYSAIYPNTTIYSIDPDGFVEEVVTTSTDPERGTIGIQSGYRYYGSNAIHFIEEGQQSTMAPVSYASTTFGQFIVDRGDPTGITTFLIYSPFEDTEVRLYDKDPDGIAGIASTSVTISKFSSGILTTSADTPVGKWVFFDSDQEVIITSLGEDGRDNTILSPAITGIGSTNYKYYPPNTFSAINVTRTAYNNFPTGLNSTTVYDLDPVVAIRQNDGSGDDILQGILVDYISDTYSWGNTLSDFILIAPYEDTTVNVSYWNGSWNLLESFDLTGGQLQTPKVAFRDGTTGIGAWGTILDGTASNFASGADLWKFEGTQPFGLLVNDFVDDEEAMLGFSSESNTRPLNKEYRSSEIQIINDSLNSYISEFGIVDIKPDAGIGTVGVGTFTTTQEGANTKLQFIPSALTEYTISGFQLNVGRF